MSIKVIDYFFFQNLPTNMISQATIPFEAEAFYSTLFLTPGLPLNIAVLNQQSLVPGTVVVYTPDYDSLPSLLAAANNAFNNLTDAINALTSAPNPIGRKILLVDGNYDNVQIDQNLVIPDNTVIMSYYNFSGTIDKYYIKSEVLLSLLFQSNTALINISIYGRVFIRASGGINIVGSTINIQENTLILDINDSNRHSIVSSSISSTVTNFLISFNFTQPSSSYLRIAYSQLTVGTEQNNYFGTIFGSEGTTGTLIVDFVSNLVNGQILSLPNTLRIIIFNIINNIIDTNSTSDAIANYKRTPGTQCNLINCVAIGSNKLNLSNFNKYFALNNKAELFDNSSITIPAKDIQENYIILPTDNVLYVHNNSKVRLTLPPSADIETGRTYSIIKSQAKPNVLICSDINIEGKDSLLIPGSVKSVELKLNNNKTMWIVSGNSSFL